ncbi:MAG: methionine adenosyltransferase [Clostridia bacterium]|nr:methionine adenosyltransferase [Clostridia bacterium]MDE7328190.1 methionine adenosyltransferase [Clostridia bacterium]
MIKRLFTSESVTEGHPDKLCDKISDSILDALLEQDPNSRVACETCANTGFILVMGEITSNANVDYESVVRKAALEIGYDSEDKGLDANTCQVLIKLDKQSSDIAMGVDSSLENKERRGDKYDLIGAGDQGMMFGYACNETPTLMPMPIYLAHKLTAKLTELRKSGELNYLRPDGKAQVSVEYVDDKVSRIEAIVLSTQHSESVDNDTLRNDIKKYVIDAVIPDGLIDKDTKIFINPTGRFVIGGPQGDSGLTGRKIIVDTYGGYCPHGGGAFSGKDSTKVDRSACYMARYVCKNIVASGIAERCQLDVAYAIGVAKPVSINVNTFGTSKLNNVQIAKIVEKVFDLRPLAIIEQLQLRKPQFAKTSNYGHFGREDQGFKWEICDKADEIARIAATMA